MSIHTHMIGIRITRASSGLHRLVQSKGMHVAGEVSNMATKAEFAPGAPLEARDCTGSDPSRYASAEMAPMTVFKPVDTLSFIAKSPSVNM